MLRFNVFINWERCQLLSSVIAADCFSPFRPSMLNLTNLLHHSTKNKKKMKCFLCVTHVIEWHRACHHRLSYSFRAKIYYLFSTKCSNHSSVLLLHFSIHFYKPEKSFIASSPCYAFKRATDLNQFRRIFSLLWWSNKKTKNHKKIVKNHW